MKNNMSNQTHYKADSEAKTNFHVPLSKEDFVKIMNDLEASDNMIKGLNKIFEKYNNKTTFFNFSGTEIAIWLLEIIFEDSQNKTIGNFIYGFDYGHKHIQQVPEDVYDILINRLKSKKINCDNTHSKVVCEDKTNRNVWISKSDFVLAIDKIKAHSEMIDEFYDLFQKHNNDSCLMDFSGIEVVVGMLEKVFNDDHEWIYYFLYELECGKKFVPKSVMVDNVYVSMKNAEEFYDFIVNYHCDEE